MVERNKLWICNKCKRAYPQDLNFCPKCNVSKKHSMRFSDAFISKENKLNSIKAKNNRIVESRKRIQDKYKRNKS